jgi:GNAT superfamily N-acetyltransferase
MEEVMEPIDQKQSNNPIELIEYDHSAEHSEAIRKLNYEWIQKHHHLEEGDIASLSNPKEYILDKGGFIYYAKLNNEIVGTVSLLKITDTYYELAKMAVTESAQGHGLGSILIKYCIKCAREKGAKKLVLYSNTKLKPAIHLYEKFGFKEVPLDPGHYERANIKMEVDI